MFGGKKARILIVHNDPEITESFGLVLEDSGLYQVTKYTDSLNVLSNFKPGEYDLVLLDSRTLHNDSFELYDKLRMIDNELRFCFIGPFSNDEGHQSLGSRFPSQRRECFVSKEVAIMDLIGRINALLEK